MTRPRRRSRRQIRAQCIAASAKAQSPETKMRHLRFRIVNAEIRLAKGEYETERQRDDDMTRLARWREELARLALLPTPPIPMGLRTTLPDANWLPLAAAAALMGLHPAHLTRRCRLDLEGRELAVRVAIEGTTGLPRWFISRDADPRLRETNTPTSDGV